MDAPARTVRVRSVYGVILTSRSPNGNGMVLRATPHAPFIDRGLFELARLHQFSVVRRELMQDDYTRTTAAPSRRTANLHNAFIIRWLQQFAVFLRWATKFH